MKAALVIFLNLIFFTAFSQQEDVGLLLSKIKQAQAKIQTIAYEALRVDTFTQGIVRSSAGKAIIERDSNDSIFGFRFKGKLDALPKEIVYDGFVGYETDTEKKNYFLFQKKYQIENLLYNSGGWLIMPELLKIDTSGTRGLQLSQNEKLYYLTIFYPDIKEYDVEKRRKIIAIDKQNMLPVSVRSHQETLGKVQDIYWEIKSMQVNQPLQYNFEDLPFLNDYAQAQHVGPDFPALKLKDTQAPDFLLELLNGKKVALSSHKDKVVLLDFWEVWCGPCVVSMPKVQALYDKYKSKGLVVYGVVNDLRNVDATKQFVKKRSILFPILKGTEQFQKNYKLDGSVPLYMLINKEGKIIFVQYGFGDDIELLIKKELAAK